VADAVDSDTLAAARKLWQGVAELPALLDRPPAAGHLKSPREQPLPLPYGHVASEGVPGKTTHYPKGIRKEARKVTLTVWGTHEQCEAALAALLGAFNARMTLEGRPKLEFPSGARLIKWWPLNDGALAREDAQKAGQDVWKCVVEGEAHSVRSEV
jgi:hypothetical protein